MNKPLTDIASERGVLSGLCQHGYNAYIEVADILEEDCFTSPYNKIVYKCITTAFKNDPQNIDVASIYSAAESLGLSHVITEKAYSEHIISLFNFGVAIDNIRKFAVKIKKLDITRKYKEVLGLAQKELLNITGDEPISEIMAVGEDSILNFSLSVNDGENEPQRISDGLAEYIEEITQNPVDQIGISTGFPRYDAAIGGGLRPGTVNMVSARPKCGKTMLASNIGYFVADQGIPVLNMDTEMQKEDHIHRTLAMMTDCYIGDVETGKFIKKPDSSRKIKDAVKKLETGGFPYYHKSIAGMPLEEQIAIIRRWLIKDVGLNSDGSVKPCLVIYDYIKLMSSDKISGNLSEFQLLGFLMTSLHNLAVKYKFPILSFGQQNRTGISEEGTDTASGSDRIIWLCSNFTIFKHKSEEEIALDGPNNGNRKLVPVVSRHGGGLEFGNYINCFMNGSIAKITEGRTKFEIEQDRRSNSESEDN